MHADLPELARLDTASLIDHLPEFVEGLSRWIDGDTVAARAAFSVLAEGHALQRLGYGVDLLTLIREYMLLRKTILRELMAVPAGEDARELMLRLNEGMDEAVFEAVRRFDKRQEALREPIALRPANMADLWQEAIDETCRRYPRRCVQLSRRGNLDGVWDHERVREVVAMLLETVAEHGGDPIDAEAREAEDRQALVTSIRYRGREVALAQMVTMREIVLAHAGYWETAAAGGTTTIAITWPRTPFDEGPPRT